MTSIYLESLSTFLQQRDLEVSLGKCSTTLFSPWNKDFKQKPSIKINNTTLVVMKNPKILGVTFDNGLNWGAHISDASSKARNRFNILKALSGTNWGLHKETIVNSYKAFVRPVLNYACPVWDPFAADTHIEKLGPKHWVQRVQNFALRVATGGVNMTAIQHLHDECQVLSVRRHTRMR